MSTSTPPSSTSLFFQDLVGDFYSRRLLLLSPSAHNLSTSAPPPSISHNSSTSSEPYGRDNSLESNIIMVLSVLLCAVICSLGLNLIIRCVLRYSSFITYDSSWGHIPARLANNGVKRKALKTFPILSYSPELNLPGLDKECVICLSEFVPGERVRLLPKCHHWFHPRCIDKWLSSHSSCPTCRHCLIETCEKIVRCSTGQAGSSEFIAQLHQPFQIIVAPLGPEGPIRNYHSPN